MEYFNAGMPLREALTAKNLNRFVRTVNIVNGGHEIDRNDPEKELNDNEIYVYLEVSSTTSISAGCAVSFNSVMVKNDEVGTYNGDVCCSGAFISGGSAVENWGIIQDDFSADSGGHVFLPIKIGGISIAKVNVLDLNHRYVNAGLSDGVLSTCTNGAVQIVGKPVSTGRQYLAVKFGGGGAVLNFGVVVTQPTGGAGAGAVQAATPTVSGGIVVSGASIPVVMPYLDGAN